MNGYGLPTGAQGLIAALAVGLVIGLERGSRCRSELSR